MKTRPLLISCLILAGACTVSMESLRVEATEKAPAKTGVLVFEGHTHIGLTLDDGELDLTAADYYRVRGVNALLFNLPVDRSATHNLLGRLTRELALLRAATTDNLDIGLAIEPQDYRDNFAAGRLSVGLAIEYFDGVFDQDPTVVEAYYDLGIRMICLVNNAQDVLFETEGEAARLTGLGRQVIDTMNRHGVLIDITHLEDRQKLAVIEASGAPVIASHANPRGPTPTDFNVSDRVIAALKDNGGLFLVSLNKTDLLPKNDGVLDGVAAVVTHLDYLRDALGIDHLGLGTDLQAAGRYVPPDLRQPDAFRRIETALRDGGYSDQDVRKVLGENLLHLLPTQEK